MTKRLARRFLLVGAAALLPALAVSGCAGAAVPQASLPGRGKRILFVFQQNSKSREVDDAAKEHLEELGYSVTYADQREPAVNACRYDLVVISATVRSRDLMAAYRDVTIPIVTWEDDILDDLRMTGRRMETDHGTVQHEHELWMVNAPHPLSASLPAGALEILNGNWPMGWGRPGLGASIIATLPGQPEKVAIFAYERGATMDYDFLAPARRVFFCLDNETFVRLNPKGLALFNAAIAWAIADVKPPGQVCRA